MCGKYGKYGKSASVQVCKYGKLKAQDFTLKFAFTYYLHTCHLQTYYPEYPSTTFYKPLQYSNPDHPKHNTSQQHND